MNGMLNILIEAPLAWLPLPLRQQNRLRISIKGWKVIVGLAASFCLPSAVGVTAHVFPVNSSPRRRSIAFAAMVVVGLLALDWASRWAAAGPGTVGNFKKCRGGPLGKASLTRVHRDVDWIGALLISACLAFLYELAVATGSDADQTVCITVFLVWGTLNASEQLTVLYLQDVRGTSTLTASLYFMPAPVCGLLMNAAIGLSLPYLKSSIAVPAGCLLSGIAPLLLATLCGVDGPGYWRGVFQAMALNSLGADLVYTIAKLVITDSFPAKTQALAGGVFNMLAQVGKSVGIATSALIARQITSQMDHAESATAMLKGYEAGWWYNCGLGFVSVAVSFGGMRSVKVIGIKRD
ncbi:aminotriazole resistance protein [Aspergillus flavus AF70]|nr:aminotriazole resistance protein [Aspergillus flavus AF70]